MLYFRLSVRTRGDRNIYLESFFRTLELVLPETTFVSIPPGLQDRVELLTT